MLCIYLQVPLCCPYRYQGVKQQDSKCSIEILKLHVYSAFILALSQWDCFFIYKLVSKW